MRNLKRIALAISAAAFALSIGAAGAQDKVLKIGTEGAYPPFNNLTADGKLVGFDVDIAQALCDEMKVKCEFVTQDWDGIIPALQAGKFDAIIASMSITPERAEKVDFTNKYYNTPSALAAPKDTDTQGRHQGRPRRQDDRRRHLDHALQLRREDLYRQHGQGLSEQPGRAARSRQRPPRRHRGRHRRAEPVAGHAGRRLLQAARHDPSRSRSKSTGLAPASRCARARRSWSTSSTPRSTPSAPTANTRKSTTSTSSSTSTAPNPDCSDQGGGELLAAALHSTRNSRGKNASRCRAPGRFSAGDPKAGSTTSPQWRARHRLAGAGDASRWAC